MRVRLSNQRERTTMARIEDTAIAVTPNDSMQSLAGSRVRSLPQQRFAIRVAGILAVVAGDLVLIVAATLTAAFIRFQSISHETTDDLLLVISTNLFVGSSRARLLSAGYAAACVPLGWQSAAGACNRRRSSSRNCVCVAGRRNLFALGNWSSADHRVRLSDFWSFALQNAARSSVRSNRSTDPDPRASNQRG